MDLQQMRFCKFSYVSFLSKINFNKSDFGFIRKVIKFQVNGNIEIRRRTPLISLCLNDIRNKRYMEYFLGIVLIQTISCIKLLKVISKYCKKTFEWCISCYNIRLIIG